MRYRSGIDRQRSEIPGLFGFVVANVAAASVLSIFALVSITTDIGFGTFSDDPSEAPVDRWFAGLLSDIGIGIWFLAAPAALVAAWAARRSVRACAFFVAMAFASAWLAADDLFLLHESVIPEVTGVPEEVTFVAYAVLMALVVAVSSRTLRDQLAWVLAGSLAAFACAVVLAAVIAWTPAVGAAGSAFKFFGIVNWTLFCVDAAVRNVRAGHEALIASSGLA